MKTEIETSRLRLRLVCLRDIPSIYREFNDAVTIFMDPQPAKNIFETTRVVIKFMKKQRKGEELVYAILKKETKEFLGLCGIHSLKSEMPELGIWTKLSAHGNHYGREAIGGAILYARELGYKKLLYPVDRRNVASKKIPLAYGGVCSGFQEELSQSGNRLEIEKYIISI